MFLYVIFYDLEKTSIRQKNKNYAFNHMWLCQKHVNKTWHDFNALILPFFFSRATYRLISEQQAVFPSVYFCDSNPFNSAKAFQLLSNLDLEDLISSVEILNEMDFLVNIASYNYINIALQAAIKQLTGSYMSNQDE